MSKTLEEKVDKELENLIGEHTKILYEGCYPLNEILEKAKSKLIHLISQATREEDLREIEKLGTLMDGMRNDGKRSIIFALDNFREYYRTKIGGGSNGRIIKTV